MWHSAHITDVCEDDEPAKGGVGMVSIVLIDSEPFFLSGLSWVDRRPNRKVI